MARSRGVMALVVAASGPITATTSPLMAETLCFRWALKKVLDFGFKRVVFESDCEVLVKA